MVDFRSITSRIIALHVLAIAITSIFMPLAIYLLLNSAADDLRHRSLADNVDAIAQYISLKDDGTWALDLPVGIKELYTQAYGRYSYTIIDDRGALLFSSLKDPSSVLPQDKTPINPSFFQLKRGDALIDGAIFPKLIRDRLIWIEVTQDLAHRDVLIDDIVKEFFWRVGWITIPILLSLLAIDVFIFRRALRPLLQASAEAKRISPTQTDIRLPVEMMPQEIRPLVEAVNHAFDRLEEGFQIQREFTADAAHELRTPLAILSVRVDTLTDRSVAELLRRDIAGMSRIVSQLLDIAELETFVVNPNETADLTEVCARVVEFIFPLALKQAKDISLSKPEHSVWIKGNSETLSRAVRNLIENAMNHAPQGSEIEVVVSGNGTVSVLDQGPGIPVEDRKFLFRRFWRRDRRRTGSAGLGLSIVHRIVEAHGGAITVGNRDTGGAAFSLHFSIPSS